MLGLATIALASLGCGEPAWHSRTYPASGTVSVNGEAAGGVLVILRPLAGDVDSRGSRPFGIVAADGTYVLETYETGDGAPPGEYAVTLVWPNGFNGSGDRFRGKYATLEKAITNFMIEETENQLPPIEIADAKLAPIEKADQHPDLP